MQKGRREQMPAHEDGTSPDVIFVVITYIINDARYGEFDDYPLK
ncbi:umuD domain protein [Escherichia coli]|nr:umuD domain protein [Salmonella enterica subsp. enterica serovar Enteritidis]EFD5018905.1 umuD domain protein [Escherichia coli]EFN6914454.1 umuD domain protein [Escherichia coli O10]EFD5338996.1 umuD domain protein [Escherichia coli]EFD5479849.1 umuD domain protein [Escherichia coli]